MYDKNKALVDKNIVVLKQKIVAVRVWVLLLLAAFFVLLMVESVILCRYLHPDDSGGKPIEAQR